MNHKANDTTHIDSIIVRYLMGSATHEETEELLRWIEQSEENKKVFLNSRIFGKAFIQLSTSMK